MLQLNPTLRLVALLLKHLFIFKQIFPNIHLKYV